MSAAQFLNDAVVEPLLDRVHSWLGSFGQELVSRSNTYTAQPPDTAAPAATKRKRTSRRQDGAKSGVYVLKLEKNRWYVGSSLNVDERIRKHRAGRCVSLLSAPQPFTRSLPPSSSGASWTCKFKWVETVSTRALPVDQLQKEELGAFGCRTHSRPCLFHV